MQIRLHHIGIVAKSEEQINEFVNLFGLKEIIREKLEKYNVTNIFFKCEGGAMIQFMIPHKGSLKNFNRGMGGLHHIALCVPNIEAAQKELQSKGIQFIAEQKQKGVSDFFFNFVMPNIAGINVELIEDPRIDWQSPTDK